jgi:putative protein-disulfide isomerase
MDRARLTYAFDAYCGWCYGFGPAVRDFAACNAERIKLRVLSGGLFTGPRALPTAAYPYIAESDRRIADLTGADFGPGYHRAVAEGTTVLDSTAAATGLIALSRQAPERELAAAGAMQRAWYREGRSLSDPRVYRDLAAELGLAADEVAADLADPGTRAEARREFQEVRRLGVDGYPTLLLHTGSGPQRLGGPVSSAAALTRALDQALART